MPLTGLTAEEQAEYEALTRATADDRERIACEASFLVFFERAWREIDPADLSLNWHHIQICEALEDITWGRNRALIVNIPPRHTKSILVNILWPAWSWAQPPERYAPLAGPHVKFLCVSYGATLAERMGLTMKRLVEGAWYQNHWGKRVEIRTDQASRADFGNTAGGERISNSIEGGILGRGGSITICFPYGALNYTERGPVCIGDLVEQRRECRVWSISATGELELQPVVGWHRNPASVLLRITFEDGSDLRCTPDHRLLTARGWMAARDLRDGDLIWTAGIDEAAFDQRDGLVADTVDFGEGAISAVAGPNLPHLVAGELGIEMPGALDEGAISHQPFRPLCADRSPLRLFDASADGSPFSAATANFPDGFDCDPKPCCQRPGRLRSLEDFDDLSLGQNGGAVPLPDSEHAMRELIGDIFFASTVGDPGEERELVAEDMAYFLSIRGSAEESACHDPVNFNRDALAIAPQLDPRISAVADVHGEDLTGLIADECLGGAPERLSVDDDLSWQTIHATEVGNLVPRESGHCSPRLVRIVAITDGGHADATYCLTVARNGTMVCGDGQVIASNCDDPQTRRGADSEIERAASLQGMSDLSTRLTDPRISAQVLIMQRLHVNDATDWALKNWRTDRVHLMYPARFDPDRESYGDPRTYRGELLWPEVWSDIELKNIEAGLKALDGDRLSDYAVAGQLQQNPIPKGGGIIKREWIEAWPPLMPGGGFPQDMVREGRIQYPAFEYVAACVDTAFTSKQQNDRSAMVVIGIFRAEGTGRIERRGDGTMVRVADDYGFPKALIMYGWAKRLELHGPPEVIPPGVSREDWASVSMRMRRRENWGLVETVDDTCKRYRADHLTILTLGQGHGLEQELRRLHSDGAYGVSMEAEVGDKEARAYAVQHLFSSRQVYAPMYEDGTVPSWCEPLLDEICIFPRGQHDDFVDATVGCLRHLRQIGLMERREEFARGEERAMAYQTNRRVHLPYEI